MLIAVRHGSTNFNGEGERFRGWKNLSLSPKGMKESENSAKRLAGLKIPINSFHSSDLLRAKQSSELISDKLGIKAVPTSKLRDWDIGEFEGKPVEDHLEDIQKYLDNQDKSIPGGESYSSFYERTAPFLKKLVESDDVHLAVMHNRLATLLKAMSKVNGKDPKVEDLKKKGPIEPAGIMVVHPDWSVNIIK